MPQKNVFYAVASPLGNQTFLISEEPLSARILALYDYADDSGETTSWPSSSDIIAKRGNSFRRLPLLSPSSEVTDKRIPECHICRELGEETDGDGEMSAPKVSLPYPFLRGRRPRQYGVKLFN